jgi:anti-anti-sigma factor
MSVARTSLCVSESGSPPTSHDRLSLSTNWLSAAVVRITAAGAIDASNAAELADYVFRHAANSRRLILDLKGVDFFGTAGFSTLMNIQARCAYAAVKWTLVPSTAVSRVLEICDPRGTLPIAKSA